MCSSESTGPEESVLSVSDFCSQILFGSTLADKLVSQSVAFGHRSSKKLLTHEVVPGRPVELQMRERQSAAKKHAFPTIGQMTDPLVRGRVLHFFANHELLALELMALVLLRFPDAPEAFVRSTVAVMRDEQKHLTAYLVRMRELGVAFGEIEVSPFFWNCLSGVDSLDRFVAGMSLTLEQANLDFAKYYRRVFAEIGDPQTRDLIGDVYEDEIRHVAHGLHWFRQWKSDRETDFEAHRRLIALPLSLQRAKGVEFDEAGRVAAGFSAQYIQELEQVGGSKGVPPHIWWFHPDPDLEVGGGEAYRRAASVEKYASDLDVIPTLLCTSSDLVLVSHTPSRGYFDQLKAIGIDVPEYHVVESTDAEVLVGLESRAVRGFRPWGWSPRVKQAVDAYIDRLPPKYRPDTAGIPASAYACYRKSFAAEFIADWLDQSPVALRQCSRLVSHRHRAIVCEPDEVALQDIVARMLANGAKRIVLKSDHGMSGSGLQWVDDLTWTPRLSSWIAGLKRTDQQLVVQPWLDKMIDWSIRIEIAPDGRSALHGMGRFLTDRRGVYLGALTASGLATTEPELTRFMRGDGREPKWLDEVVDDLSTTLGARCRELGYTGPIGIDAIFYRDEAGQIRLHPMLEINPRWTMGFVGDAMHRRVAPGNIGLMLLVRDKDVNAVYPGVPWKDSLRLLLDAAPPQLRRCGIEQRLVGGLATLSDLESAQGVVLLYCVAKRLDGALGHLQRLGDRLLARMGASHGFPCLPTQIAPH